MKKLYVYLFAIAALAIVTGCHHHCKDPCYRNHPSNGDIVVKEPTVKVKYEKPKIFEAFDKLKNRHLQQEALSNNKADMQALREAKYGKKSRGRSQQRNSYDTDPTMYEGDDNNVGYVIDENGIYRRPSSGGNRRSSGGTNVNVNTNSIAIGENSRASNTVDISINGKKYE
jgi:hypothetical protein